MNYEDFIQNIEFSGIDPMVEAISFSAEFRSLRVLIDARTGLNQLDRRLAILPENQDEYLELLSPISDLPRMSTFAVAAIISRTVGDLAPDTAYVNIGIWHGYTLLAGMLGNQKKTIVGVDNFSEFGGPKDHARNIFEQFKGENHFFYDLDYRDYFSNFHEGEIGFYFYDGEHSYENQIEGLRVAEKFFAPGAVIMVDDTNWEGPRRATLDFISESPNTYKIILDRRTAWDGHPTFWNGIIVFRRVG